MPDNRLTAIIVGAGHRAVGYARKGRDSIRVVGIADPRDQRREMIADEFGIPVKHLSLIHISEPTRPY